ncbi:hypothetical protein DFH06DRAFT_986352, partial [Mycena polygramma]
MRGNQLFKLSFDNALHTPDLAANLVSVGKLAAAGYVVSFSGERASVLNANGHGFSCKKGANGMYQLGGDSVEIKTGTTVLAAAISLETLHRCLAHADTQAILEMHSKGLVDGLEVGSHALHGKCVNCIHGKTVAQHHDHPIVGEAVEPGDLVCADLWEARTRSRGGAKYMMMCVD